MGWQIMFWFLFCRVYTANTEINKCASLIFEIYICVGEGIFGDYSIKYFITKLVISKL